MPWEGIHHADRTSSQRRDAARATTSTPPPTANGCARRACSVVAVLADPDPRLAAVPPGEEQPHPPRHPGWLMGNPEIFIALGHDPDPRHRDLHPVPRRRPFAAHAAAAVATRTSASTTSSAPTRPGAKPSTRSTCSSPTRPSQREMGGTPVAACCSKVRPAPARPTSPRRWPPRPACRSCSCRPASSSRCTTARPTARSARSSRRCARRPAPRAAPSASSRSSTPSAAPAAA